MSNDVYANGNAVACKKGDDKVIAAMPDVCLSPPSPPAGPIPVPYPNTSFSKDMQSGSKTVQINGGEVMLKDQSFYKTSPLGDEAATRSFGASVITHVITGKTYFNAWSMDIQFEGANADRHLDLTTSNHASYPGSTGPMSAMEALALDRIAENKCPCCGKDPMHAAQRGEPISEDDWYDLNEQITDPEKPEEFLIREPNYIGHNPDYATWQADCATNAEKRKALKKRREMVAAQKKCPTKPEAPCNVYFRISKELAEANEAEWRTNQAPIKEKMGVPLVGPDERGQVDHRVPISAGGCPTGEGNLQDHSKMNKKCQKTDKHIGNVQKDCAEKAKKHPDVSKAPGEA